jgi:predicted enzyme related to lactoylglutathione lyase
MTSVTEPLYRTGKICYVEIPAINISQSAEFYSRVFGWAIRRHDDGSLGFDDTVGGVSGMWATGRAPMTEAGLIVSVMVADVAAMIDHIGSAGGQIVLPPDEQAAEKFAWFRDPAGNVLGIYQQPGLAETEAATD